MSNYLKASQILNHFSNFSFFAILLSLALLDLSLHYICAIPAQERNPNSNRFFFTLFKIQLAIMSSHVEQSHCDTLSGFNHSESQRERGRGTESQRGRESNNHFFSEMVAGQCSRHPPPARKLNTEECQRVLHLSHTYTHTALVLSVPLNTDRWLIAPLCMCV